MTFELHGVSVRHTFSASGPAALQDLTLSIGQGEQVALIGPSGAGKTTLLHTLACAHRPDSGNMALFGIDPWKASDGQRQALRSRLFLAPQMPPLPPRQRVVTAVLAGRLPRWSLWQAIASLFRPADPQAAYDALARFNLQDKLYSRVDRLSGGERQRCSMARLLVSHAEAFLVDEPLSALDPALAVQTLAVLQEEASSRKAALVCSLHQVDLARVHFPRVIGVRAGRIVFDAAREAVTDDMIGALYRHADPAPVMDETPDAPATVTLPTRCF
ncbi:MAG TPA: ATP-binding cassette domain-containing protein [Noviherbaspirillum sp.]|nr:ATP-binding cassette domain-containing protein [Noviherbaspirillum sp.]